MVTIEQLTDAAIRRDSLMLRALAQELVRTQPRLRDVPRPDTSDPLELAVAAALLELFAQRTDQPQPDWTASVGAPPEPFYLVDAAARMRRLRVLCESQAPEPLRKRRLYAPPGFLQFA
jgi:hypothetical protein